jgi:hypothetical protein
MGPLPLSVYLLVFDIDIMISDESVIKRLRVTGGDGNMFISEKNALAKG